MVLSGAAAGAAGALEDLLKQKFFEQIQKATLAERARETDLRNTVEHHGLDLGERRTTEDARQFDVTAGHRDRGLKLDEQAQPVRLKHVEAQTGELLRRPQAEQAERDFTTGRDKTQHGYSMTEIGAQGRNALAVASVRHPDPNTAAAQAEKEGDIDSSLALIQQIREDKFLPNATGPIQGRGAGALWGMADYERVKALHDNLTNRLQLAQAGKLKGQGQISNFERDMLAKAATALTRTLGDPDYLKELAKVEDYFKSKQAGPRVSKLPTANNAGTVVTQEFDYVPGKGFVPRKK